MGSYLGERHNVTLYVRQDAQKLELKQKQIQPQVNGKQIPAVEVQVKNISALSNHDCLFVCVKQPQLKSVFLSLQRLNRDIPIVFLQNGMGHIEAAKMLPQ